MKGNIKKLSNVFFGSVSITAFSIAVLMLCAGFGCDKIKKSSDQSSMQSKESSSDSSPVAVTFSNGTRMTVDEVNKEMAKILEQNPYARGMDLSSLPGEFKKMLFDQVVALKTILIWAEKNGFDKDPEVNNRINELLSVVRFSVYQEKFVKKVQNDFDQSPAGKAIEAKAKDYYAKNKNRFQKSAGGVRTVAAVFEKVDDAKEFLASVKKDDVCTLDAFKSAQANFGAGKFEDLGRISDDVPAKSIPKEVAEYVSKLSDCPVCDKVSVGSDCWVLCCIDKTDGSVAKFEEVKDQIISQLKGAEMNKALESEFEALKAQFVTSINQEVFKAQVAPAMEGIDPQSLADMDMSAEDEK